MQDKEMATNDNDIQVESADKLGSPTQEGERVDQPETVQFMCPDHPRWDDFLDILEGPDGCNFHLAEPGNENSLTWACDVSAAFSKTRKVLAEMGLSLRGHLAIPCLLPRARRVLRLRDYSQHCLITIPAVAGPSTQQSGAGGVE
jgi:hypothetical protein